LSTFEQNHIPDDDMHLKRAKVKDFFMEEQWKNNTKGTLSESQQKRIAAHFHENQFAE
jgi:hypothetical protein